jgi:hypothetical protein
MEATKSDNAHLWNQFIRLGEMMGDGLHYESDGKWISKEYRKLAKILIPEMKEESAIRRKLKNASTDIQMAKLLEDRKCGCGGGIKQKRSGSKVAYCQTCGSRYVAKPKKSS